MKSFKEFTESIGEIKFTIEKGDVDLSRFPDDPETTVYIVRAIIGNKVVGYANFYEDYGTIENVQVVKKYRRKGVATRIYDFVENKFKIKLEPSDVLELDGLSFWKNREPSNRKIRYK